MQNNFRELTVAVISSFAYDEPLVEILQASADLPTVQFYITGDKSKLNGHVLKCNPENVIFTGFLDSNSYVSLLQSVDVIMVLTKRDRTMLAGAYEALSIKKPLITSNWSPLKRYFNKGTIFVDNSPSEIKLAIIRAQKYYRELLEEICQLKVEKLNEWKETFLRFESILMQARLKTA